MIDLQPHMHFSTRIKQFFFILLKGVVVLMRCVLSREHTGTYEIGSTAILCPQLAAIDWRGAVLSGIAGCSNGTEYAIVFPNDPILGDPILPPCQATFGE